MGIVDSNAYINTNVHQMAIPRMPIMFKEIRELLRDNFQIYTRILFGTIDIGNLVRNEGDFELPSMVKNMPIVVRTEVSLSKQLGL